jgi:hypothetical protein
VNLRRRGQKVFDLLALVSREVVGDYVDFLAARLVDQDVGKESDELSATGGLAGERPIGPLSKRNQRKYAQLRPPKQDYLSFPHTERLFVGNRTLLFADLKRLFDFILAGQSDNPPRACKQRRRRPLCSRGNKAMAASTGPACFTIGRRTDIHTCNCPALGGNDCPYETPREE